MQHSNIEWTEFVSNPIKGKCGHFKTSRCGGYCYAEAIRKRFKQPEAMSWHPEELEAIRRRKKPATIFVGSAYDLFGAWVPKDWIRQIVQTARDCPRHTFLFLTKNPQRHLEFEFPGNCWTGYTDTGEGKSKGANFAMKKGFISFEPLLGGIIDIDPSTKQVIIGAQTGPGTIKPENKWVWDIIDSSPKEAAIFVKNNLDPDTAYRDLAWRRNG